MAKTVDVYECDDCCHVVFSELGSTIDNLCEDCSRGEMVYQGEAYE